MKTHRTLAILLAAAFVLAGATAHAGATITGKCKLDGAAPADKEIKMDADAKCVAQHGGKPAMNDNYTVNADNAIHNVLVYVKNKPAGNFATPTTPITIDQKGCQYMPKVMGIMVNQPFEIINSDPTLHNIHALPKVNKEFNLGMPTQGQKVNKSFATPEWPPIKIKCDVHPWMFAYVGVFDHPFFSATGTTGSFTIKDLPPGKYTLEAWHNKYGTQTAEVEVKEGETKNVDFTFKPPAAAATP